VFWMSFCFGAIAQNRLTGRVVDAGSRTPVALANVFLASTSIGTVTGERGEFVINQLPEGNYDLVVSCIGYETYTRNIRSKDLPLNLQVELKARTETLREVTVSNNERSGWEKWGPVFLEHFIGTSVFAEDMQLMNKEALIFDFNRLTNKLKVTARERLVMENHALGYVLKYDLTRFEYDTAQHMFMYGGYSFFEEMQPRNAAVKLRWQRNRQDAYRGSLLHFVRSLYAGQLEKQGFEVRPKLVLTQEEKLRVKKIYDAVISQQNGLSQTMSGIEMNKYNNRDSLNYFRLVTKNPAGTVLAPDPPLQEEQLTVTIDSTAKRFHFIGKLEVRFPSRKFPREYGRPAIGISREAPRINLLQGMPLITDIELDHGKPVTVFADGSLADGINLITTYYWAWWEKMANILPYDYKAVGK